METAPPINMGRDAFIWWMGIVEDRADPLKLGRVRVRIFGVHNTDTSAVSTDQLPWAIPAQDITSAARQGVGSSPTGIAVGSWVMGFFLDSHHRQQPVILATFAGQPGNVSDVSKLATGSETISKGQFPSEPSNHAAPQYPYNKTITSESGHVIEIDDTPGNTRLHVYHKDGTYIEFLDGGDAIVRTVGDSYDGTGGSKTVYVNDNINISVGGSATIQVEGRVTVNASQAVTVHSPSIEISEQAVSVSAGDPQSVPARNRVSSDR